jgi:lipopolysaccharide export system protein LptA
MRSDSVLTTILFLTMAFSAHAANKAAMPFSQNSGTPIDISADQLEIVQSENKAIFTGHVVAVQGDIRLTSEKMTVHYKQQQNNAKAKKGSGIAGQNSIEKIEVEQNVFLATPTETASGTSGVYDVENHNIVLNNEVVLTKDKNTLKGDHLVYDFNTGKSTITSGSGVASPGGKPKGRVRALFIPENNDKKKE